MERDKKTDLLPGTLETLILKTLDRAGSRMHGYGSAQYIKQVSNDVLRVKEGSLYSVLQRLTIKGWVKAGWRQSENNCRARFYKLTPWAASNSNKKRRASSLACELSFE